MTQERPSSLHTMGQQHGRRSWAEPWKIKMVEPLKVTTREQQGAYENYIRLTVTTERQDRAIAGDLLLEILVESDVAARELCARRLQEMSQAPKRLLRFLALDAHQGFHRHRIVGGGVEGPGLRIVPEQPGAGEIHRPGGGRREPLKGLGDAGQDRLQVDIHAMRP